jgi:hypothetical protein
MDRMDMRKDCVAWDDVFQGSGESESLVSLLCIASSITHTKYAYIHHCCCYYVMRACSITFGNIRLSKRYTVVTLQRGDARKFRSVSSPWQRATRNDDASHIDCTHLLRNMKRITALCLISIISVLLSGCNAYKTTTSRLAQRSNGKFLISYRIKTRFAIVRTTEQSGKQIPPSYRQRNAASDDSLAKLERILEVSNSVTSDSYDPSKSSEPPTLSEVLTQDIIAYYRTARVN